MSERARSKDLRALRAAFDMEPVVPKPSPTGEIFDWLENVVIAALTFGVISFLVGRFG